MSNLTITSIHNNILYINISTSQKKGAGGFEYDRREFGSGVTIKNPLVKVG
jgi:hypothetical protein